MFCCLSLFLFQFILQPADAFASRTFVGKYLVDHELKTVKVKDWLGCLNGCFEEPLCISYNYHQNSNTCKLKEHGVEDFSYPEWELVDEVGWIFHQLRPVTMTTNKVLPNAPCPCNCGSSDQCYVEPGVGDVPEKAEGSCSNILAKRSQAPDKAYYLKKNNEAFKYKVFCQMSPINDCDNATGGWTLVMKINGSKQTFDYDADLWTNHQHPKYNYQEQYGSDISENETKLQTFNSINFKELCLGMKTANTTRWVKIVFKPPSTTMAAIFDGHVTPNLNSIQDSEWPKRLIEGSILDADANEFGFNQIKNEAKVRIGMAGKQSYIGFGTGGKEFMGKISCGNVYQEKVIPAFGYIFGR